MNTKRIERFIEERARGWRYDGDGGTKAAVRAGFPPASASMDAVVLMTDPKIAEAVKTRLAQLDSVVEFTDIEVLREWILVATADPAKISHVRRVNCRHCWGVGHEYQWSAREYAKACDAAASAADAKGNPAPKMPPDCSGGFGWVHNAAPSPECPECRGEGIEETFFADMQTLGPAERRLIASVKRTRDGLEVKTRDQDAAVQSLAKHLGMLVEKREVTGKNGGPLVAAVVPVELPDDPQALAALYSKLIG